MDSTPDLDLQDQILMVSTLGLDSQVVLLEGLVRVITVAVDTTLDQVDLPRHPTVKDKDVSVDLDQEIAMDMEAYNQFCRADHKLEKVGKIP